MSFETPRQLEEGEIAFPDYDYLELGHVLIHSERNSDTPVSAPVETEIDYARDESTALSNKPLFDKYE